MAKRSGAGKACAPRKPAVRYSKEKAEAICARLTQGETWSRIVRDPDMPSYPVFYAWQHKHPEFAEAVAAARAGSAAYLEDLALDAAEAATRETVQEKRLLVNTLTARARSAERKWTGRKPLGGEEAPIVVEKVVFYVRQFERVVGEDGRTYIREIPVAPDADDPQ